MFFFRNIMRLHFFLCNYTRMFAPPLAHSTPLTISSIYRTLEHYLLIKYLRTHLLEQYGTLQNITLDTIT